MPQRFIVIGAVLATAVATAVAGVAAQVDAPGQERGRSERRTDRDRRDRPRVQGFRLEGRGSHIGVIVSDPDGATAGVRVDEVDAGSPAATAGVQKGDLIVEFDGERVRSARQLTRLVQETPEGRTVKMAVTRGGARQMLDITPEASPVLSWRLPAVDEPEIRAEVERGLRGLRELPRPGTPMFDFRVDGAPAFGVRGRLGVRVETLSDQLAEYFGVKGGGVLVSSVTAGSPAATAGLKAGDVITAVNGTAVRDAGELVDELRDVRDGAEVTLEIVRDKQTSTMKATLERRTSSRSRRPAA